MSSVVQHSVKVEYEVWSYIDMSWAILGNAVR